MTDSTELIHRLMGRFIGYWLTEVRKVSPRTVSAYRDSCRSYLAWLKETAVVTAAKVKLEHFSSRNAADFISWLNGRGLKASTVNLRLTALKAFAEFAMEEEPSTWEILHGVTGLKPLREPAVKVIKHLTKPQLKTLLSVIDVSTKTGRRDYTLIAFCYITAARVSELTGLRLGDVIKDGRKRAVRICGKGGKTRIVPLEGEKFLRSFNSYMRLFHSCSSEDDFLFYTSYRGNKAQMSRTTVDALLKKYGDKAKEKDPDFPAYLHCHMLRHSRAMHLHAESMPITHLRDFMGHSSIESTSIYAWTDVKTIRKDLKKVSKLRTEELEKEEKSDGISDAEAMKLMMLS